MARQIDRKLRLTAALLGLVSRKDLAAAFRRVNVNTAFELGRADKWLQGRAQPRQLQIYEDWSLVLGLEKPGHWVADSDVDAFLGEICARHGRDRDELLRLADRTGVSPGRQRPGLTLAGTYVCYSHAWSPYFRGRLVRGELAIAEGPNPRRLATTYTERLPTGPMKLEGALTVSKNALNGEVWDPTGEAQMVGFCLFPATPPASVLAGLMFGTTLIGPDAQPSSSRVVMVRLAAPGPIVGQRDAYLSPQASLAQDLAGLGLDVPEPAAVDRAFAAFLRGGPDGFDQVPVAAYRALLGVFDPAWLVQLASVAAA